jgi:hypothetical protein
MTGDVQHYTAGSVESRDADTATRHSVGLEGR